MRQVEKHLLAMLNMNDHTSRVISGGNSCKLMCFHSNIGLIEQQSKNSHLTFQDEWKIKILSLDPNLDLKLKCCSSKGSV